MVPKYQTYGPWYVVYVPSSKLPFIYLTDFLRPFLKEDNRNWYRPAKDYIDTNREAEMPAMYTEEAANSLGIRSNSLFINISHLYKVVEHISAYLNGVADFYLSLYRHILVSLHAVETAPSMGAMPLPKKKRGGLKVTVKNTAEPRVAERKRDHFDAFGEELAEYCRRRVEARIEEAIQERMKHIFEEASQRFQEIMMPQKKE